METSVSNFQRRFQSTDISTPEVTPETTSENSPEVDSSASVESDSYECFEEQMEKIYFLKSQGYPCDTKIVHSENDAQKKLFKEREFVTTFFASEKKKEI